MYLLIVGLCYCVVSFKILRSYVMKYKRLSLTTSFKPGFQKLHIIARYYRLFSGHKCLTAHAFELGLNDCASSLFSDCRNNKCDAYYLLLFNCPYLDLQRQQLSNLCSSFNTSVSVSSLMSSKYTTIIKMIVNFFLLQDYFNSCYITFFVSYL